MSDSAAKLGLMPPLTGLVGIYGAEISRAGQIACKEVNDAGGVLGRPLELVIEDDGSLPESAVVAANRLVHEHRCTAIIGNLLSNSRIAVAYRVAEPKRIPYLNFSFYEGSILSRYFFHFAALPNQQIDRMVPYMRARFGPRMFFAGNNYEWPRGSIDAAKRALVAAGGEVVGEEYQPIGVSADAIEAVLARVEAAAPDVFVPYFAGDDQLHLLTRFTERGLKARMAVVMGHYDEVMASRLPAAVREDLFSCNTYFMSVDTPENRGYLARLAAWPGVDGIWPQGNGILTNFGEGCYLCVKAFAAAANRAGSLDAEALVDTLAEVEVSGPQGSVRMDPATHHARVNTYLARCLRDGAFEIVEAFGANEPVLPERYRHLRISTRTTLEEEVRLQSRMLEQMVEAVFLINAEDAAIIYANPGAERMFGYNRGELIGKPEAVLALEASPMPGTVAREGHCQGEIRSVKKDGSLFWCSVSASIFTHPVYGEVWLSVRNDITELKELQTRLAETSAYTRSLIEASLDPLVAIDAEGRITDVNEATIRATGVSRERLIGTDFADYFTEPEKAREGYRRVFEMGFVTDYPLTICHREGGQTDVLYNASVYRDEQGAVAGVFAAARDVTERKLAGEALRQANEQLTETLEKLRVSQAQIIQSEKLAALGTLAAGVAHELNNPLMGVMNYVGFARRHVQDPELQYPLDRADQELKRIRDLLKNMLTFARPSVEGLTVIDLGAVLARTVDLLAPEFRARQITFTEELPESLPRVSGQAGQLQQVFLNLLLNARDAVQGREEKRVSLRAYVTDGAVAVEVRDTGEGIPEAIQGRIFDPFFTTKPPGQGTGLGLSIVQSIITELGGTIGVASAPGEGATFTVTLPQAPPVT